MQRSQISSTILLLSVSLILLSCSAAPTQGWDIPAQKAKVEETKAKTSRNGVIITKSAQRPRLIRKSKSAPWLDDYIMSNYRELDAKTAILAILDQRPVRFEVLSNGPKVKALPDAATYREHLNSIATQANWAYTVNHGVVSFSDWQVISYALDFILGNREANLNVSGIIEGQENKNSLDVANDKADELTQMMERILGDTAIENQRKPSFSVIKSTNSVLVSAPPNIHREVKNALSSINSVAGRNVYLDFDIYTIDLEEQYQRAVDFDVFRAAGINLTSQMTSELTGDLPFVMQLDFAEGNAFDNSKLLLKALATHGDATLFNQGSLLLKNNQVGNIQTSSLNRFVEIAIDNQKSQAPAYRESLLQVLPSIIDDKINLHLTLSNTNVEPYLKSLSREPVLVTSGSSSTQQMQTSLQIENIKLGEQFIIPTQVRDGKTLMLAGLTNKAYNNNKSKNQLIPTIGDGIDRRQGRRETIIVMTAHLLN